MEQTLFSQIDNTTIIVAFQKSLASTTDKASKKDTPYKSTDDIAEIISVIGSENGTSKVETAKTHIESTSSVTRNNVGITIKHDLYSILSACFENEIFETGIVNQSEKYFLNEFKKDALGSLNTLQLLFWNNFSLYGRKTNNLTGILHTISHMDYEAIYPIGVSMAISALNHKNNEVAEYAIKCFENWNHVDGISKLESVKFSSKWLEDYAVEVIAELKTKK